MPPRPRPLHDRLWERIAVGGEDDCWPWQGPTSGGYGVIGREGGRGAGTLPAHRVAYEDMCGPIPVGLVIDHLCENTACCNPKHMEPVTQAVNVARAAVKRKTCPRGHPLDGLRKSERRKGERYCLRCNRERVAAFKRRRRLER